MRKETLQTFCHSLKIEHMGIAGIGPYLELEQIIQSRNAKNQYTEFEEKCINKRIDPRLTMEDVQSVIVCLFPYYTGEKIEGNLAKYAHALDYHRIVKDKLDNIGKFCAGEIPGFHYSAFVDTGPLVDRYLAYLAGLGFYGRNNHIITEQYGSYVSIGYLLTNYPFEIDKPLEGSCLQCGRCIAACPGQAILDDYTIDPNRCRSYLTQKKGELTEAEINIIKKNKLVFGCDICQDVCPHNEKIAVTQLTEFQEEIVSELNYEELVTISNKEFMRRYGNRAFSWRGRKLIVRNFEYLLRNR
ncbi:tRNA epoxyqueuosine(34) reductase QueG [Pelosinus sp. sgz500959]|uniref:tRNA epoxyqueuosine(34) reductase QueG n=1 Tax=Pelosinus sp. sgz500959 TaxID=3242472 RepID=UPI00366AF897